MTKINATAQKVFNALTAQFPNQTEFKRSAIHAIAIQLGYGTKNYKDLIGDEFKVRKGLYNYATLIDPSAVKPTTTLNLAKATSAKKPAKAPKSDRTWKGKKIIDADGDFVTVDSTSKGFTGYVEKDGVGQVYRDGEKVSEINYNSRKSND